ncbi:MULTISPECIES: serine hydrolase [Tatumella]|uniref:serine-type D-Ala-D-Ala carboxypeptidase n=1 Tax=Tatumella punctata TaxID=399969 RepID=A0ABW1VQF2_9GAMM|nr:MULTISPECIES: serine hydrolase [unclassified Tatumella]MBS0854684.1 serine hydrolase [Tatumella sp. JGM16]MBS0875955.1 serine hydrolase [Tatumella sp. JGM82]MBS0890360.1 serine hydrolase [Tatumella sp. JGM94]MBS0892534.1 serine hydrolase [Tatumella sp. JGM130]MBS0900486.1 serine hydrolase [Tatumella sp. JGM100]
MQKTCHSPRYRAVMIALLLVSPVLAHADQPADAPQIDAKAWILMDYNSGKVLAESHADDRLDPASLTKMMTSYVVGQALKSGKIKSTDMVSIGQDAWATGNPKLRGSSLMFLKPGDQVSVSDLNKGIVIQSGNDACIALADYVAGSQSAFIDLMNNYVKQLGLQNTHFSTVHGLDEPGQYSTARDMALIGQALIRDVPDEYALNKEKEFSFNNIRQPNRNRLLWSTDLQVDGIKTGYTSGAGNNLVASATSGNMRLISVVLGAKTDAIRFRESEKLLNWGFRYYETVFPIKADKPFVQQRVWYGDSKYADLGVMANTAVTLPRGQVNNLKAGYTLNTPVLEAPLNKGQVVGTVNFQLGGKVIDQKPLVVMEEVKQGSFFSRILDFISMKISTLYQKWFG